MALLGLLVGGSGISAIFIAKINNKHNRLENEKDRQNKLKIEEEKTKRLISQLQNEKEERIKLNQENSNYPTFILKMQRKTEKETIS